jgi:IstB-like ATP binding protein
MSLPSSADDDLVPILKALGLTALGATLPTVLEQARQQQPTYDAFLRLALQAEVSGRAERAHARRLRAARLPARKALESFDFRFQPSVPERLIRELATLGFVETGCGGEEAVTRDLHIFPLPMKTCKLWAVLTGSMTSGMSSCTHWSQDTTWTDGHSNTTKTASRAMWYPIVSG